MKLNKRSPCRVKFYNSIIKYHVKFDKTMISKTLLQFYQPYNNLFNDDIKMIYLHRKITAINITVMIFVF